MFTGIIQRKGKVENIELNGESGYLIISIDKEFDKHISIGDSIAINGTCLTVIEVNNKKYKFEVLEETFNKTSFRYLSNNDFVNLESALSLGDMLGGHIVTGHIDGVAKISSIKEIDRDWVFSFSYPKVLSSLLVSKGSIAVDGVSLTVAELFDNKFTVHIIPHTYSETIFSTYKVDQLVNIEMDLLGKYVKRIFDLNNYNNIVQDNNII